MNSMMIDIETLGLKDEPRVPMFEIGMVVFNLEKREILHIHQIYIDLLDVILQTGFCPDQGTIDWWRKQEYKPHAARQMITLENAMDLLDYTWNDYRCEEVWANSPAFDCKIIEAHGFPVPWTHKNQMCYRTVRRRAMQRGMADFTSQEELATHKAVEDALYQTKALFYFEGGEK